MVHLLRPGVYPARNATCFVNPNYAPAVVAAGQFSDLEPFAAVLEAFSRLNKGGGEAVFFMIGNGRRERQLRRLAERMGLLTELTFVDRANQENLTEILRAADIFISPLGRRRVDVELLSAMAAGTPVLAAGAEACDFVIPDQTALTFTAGDAEAIGDRLKMLLADRAFARQLAENALAHLREHHSPARIAGELTKAYLAEAARPIRA
jgi:glycosyltransferase involved in cell wall biosynthesis